MALVLAARMSLAESPSRISCVNRFAAVSESLSVAASVTPDAVEIGRGDFLFLGQRFDLRRRPVNEHHANVQRTEHRDVEQDVGKVFVGDDGAIQREDEGLLAESRNVLQDAPQVSWFHVSFVVIGRCSDARRLVSSFGGDSIIIYCHCL
jgi:hypothetical protein